jgi:GTP-binding protein
MMAAALLARPLRARGGGTCGARAAAALADSLAGAFAEEAAPKDQAYVDRLKIQARGGGGGHGCASLQSGAARGRRAFPDGGDGGDGGAVVLRATAAARSLAGVRQVYKGEAGAHGSSRRRAGRAGRDVVVLVPAGTVVWRLREPAPGGAGGGFGGSATAALGGGTDTANVEPASAEGGGDAAAWLRRWREPWVGARDYDPGDATESDNEAAESSAALDAAGVAHRKRPRVATADSSPAAQGYELLADLGADGDAVVAAAGGGGGGGNAARGRAARSATATRGAPGEAARLLLELKLRADVALLGLPNAGKSSLLRALSAATPRTAGHAFTTLQPQLGAVALPPAAPGGGGEFADDSAAAGDALSVVLADIPGLVAGAHEGRGLGLRFLRHAERARALAFVLDAAGGTPGGSTPLAPAAQLALLRDEAGRHDAALLRRPWLVIANKVDLLPAPAGVLAALRRRAAAAAAAAGEPPPAAVVGASATGGGGAPRGLTALLSALRRVADADADAARAP